MSWEFVVQDIHKLYNKKVKQVKKLGGYGDKFNFIAVDDENEDEQFVFKVKFYKPNTHKEDIINRSLLHLLDQNFTVPRPFIRNENVNDDQIEIFKYVKEKEISKEVSHDLISFVPGSILAFTTFGPNEIEKAMFNLGQYCALMNKDLQRFNEFTTCGVDDTMPFFMENSMLIVDKMPYVKSKELQDIVNHFMIGFDRNVIPNLHKLRRGIIHGDFNDLNVTVLSRKLAADSCDPDHTKMAFGAFDFEDMHYGYYVFELAICMMYLIAKVARDGMENPWKCGGFILAGYHQIFPFTDDEIDVLYWAVASRFCVSLVHSFTHPPETVANNPLIYVQSKMCEPLLKEMLEKGREEIMKTWLGQIDS